MTERNYTIDFNNPEKAARDIITVFLDQLESLRRQTKKPAELEWEIRVYRYMLEDPLARLTAYREARRAPGGGFATGMGLLTKREAVRRLGWNIP